MKNVLAWEKSEKTGTRKALKSKRWGDYGLLHRMIFIGRKIKGRKRRRDRRKRRRMRKESGGEKMGRDEGREEGRGRKERIQWQFLGQGKTSLST